MLCFFTVVYSLGLRLQEALLFKVTDIDRFDAPTAYYWNLK